jgi:hypothetical protein
MPNRQTSSQHKKLKQLMHAVFMLCTLDRTLKGTMLDDLIRAARLRAEHDVERLGPKRRVSVDYDLIGHIVYRWQRMPEYLDEHGKPIAIPARGPAPSVEALFKKLKVDRKQLFRLLKQFKQLRRVRVTRSGRYIPQSEVTIIPTLTPEVVESLTQTINNLLATILHNTSSKQPNAVRFIERATIVPDLPATKVPEFKQFAREQAAGLLKTIDDWLENQRGRAPRRVHARGRVSAGLHVFAFVNKRRH